MHKNIQNIAKMVFGAGSFGQLSEILKSRRKQSYMVFLVDDCFQGKSLADRIPLENDDKLIWVNVDVEPKTDVVDKLKKQIMDFTGEKPDGVIGIGGGSCMDYAKAVAVMLNHEGSSSLYQGLNLAFNPSVYHVGIPTLSGTGAEVSTTAVLTGPEKKLGIKYEGTPFDQIILDPELISEAPSDQRFYTGMDCYIHNIESLTGTMKNAFSDAMGEKSLELCRDVFVHENGNRMELDSKLMVASYLGGVALSYSEVGVCHAFSYGLSYILGTKHGVANCIAFNQLEDFYPEGVKEFKHMMQKHQISLPENITADLNDSQLEKMVETSWALTHMWHHAFGEDWKNKISKDKVKEIFLKM